MSNTTKITIGFTMEVPLLEGFEHPTIVQRNTLQAGDMYRHLSAYASYYSLGHLHDATPPVEVHKPTNTTELVVGWRKHHPITPADGWQESKNINRVDRIAYSYVVVRWPDSGMCVHKTQHFAESVKQNNYDEHYPKAKFIVLQNAE